MTSKTFKSELARHPRRLHLEENKHGVNIRITDPEWRDSYGITVATSDAPALALAILEAAGVVHHDPDDTPYEKSERTENMGALNMSAFYLAKHVSEEEKAAFLIKEQADLEAEALELRNAFFAVERKSWDEVAGSGESKKDWLRAARKAREMRAQK